MLRGEPYFGFLKPHNKILMLRGKPYVGSIKIGNTIQEYAKTYRCKNLMTTCK